MGASELLQVVTETAADVYDQRFVLCAAEFFAWVGQREVTPSSGRGFHEVVQIALESWAL